MAKVKGIRCEAGVEERWRQNSGLINRNHILFKKIPILILYFYILVIWSIA